MKKQFFITILFSLLISMIGTMAFAHDIEVVNSDGVTIYYVWGNNNKELAVSCRGTYGTNSYSGNVVIPESVEYENSTYSVTSIRYNAFEKSINLTSVTIPNSIKEIGMYAFYDCSSLTSIIIPNSVTRIGDGTFSGCSHLASFTIPNSVTSIDSEAFSGCNGLTSITIPNGVKIIGKSAFAGCKNLTSVTIGNNITSIGSDAFSDTNLKKVIWLTNTPPSGYLNANGSINYVTNNQFSSLNNKVVYQSLSSIFEVDGIKYVPVSSSERTCDAIDCVYNESATDTKIASNVKYKGITMKVNKMHPFIAYNNIYIRSIAVDYNGEISDYAFAYCSNMKSAIIGEKLSAIGNYSFNLCTSLESIIIPDGVTSIGEYAFSSCTSLGSVKMGNCRGTINQFAFCGCTALQDIIIGLQVNDIKDYAFQNCTTMPEITIPKSVTKIGDGVFSGCDRLKKFIIADREEILYLGSNIYYDDTFTNRYYNSLFANCPLDTVYIGGDISFKTSKDYGYSPFYRNTSLRAINFTDKETEISANEFNGCTNLQIVSIGDGVATIGDGAFSGCSSLKYLSFGTQLQSMGKEALSNCMSVKEIISKATTPPICGSQALSTINKWDCKLYVPEGTISAYQEADQWKDFFFVDEGIGCAEFNPTNPENKKCDNPTISIEKGKLKFSCGTEGVTYHYYITSSGNNEGEGNNIDFPKTYKVSVYASKYGYMDSEIVTSLLEGDSSIIGDLNNDGEVNVADHVELSKIIMAQ